MVRLIWKGNSLRPKLAIHVDENGTQSSKLSTRFLDIMAFENRQQEAKEVKVYTHHDEKQNHADRQCNEYQEQRHLHHHRSAYKRP